MINCIRKWHAAFIGHIGRREGLEYFITTGLLDEIRGRPRGREREREREREGGRERERERERGGGREREEREQ